MKRGIVMPLVLAFILLSQIIYWGLIRLNRSQSQLLVLYQDAYQSDIQLSLFEHVLSEKLNIAPQLEANILQAMSKQASLNLPQDVAAVMFQTDQFGLLHLDPQSNYQRVYLYSQQLFLRPDGHAYLTDFQQLTLNGSLDSQNFPLALIAEDLDLPMRRLLDQEVAQTLAALEAEGFRLVKESNQRNFFHWQYQLDQALHYATTNGYLQLTQESQGLRYASHIAPRGFQSSQLQPFARTAYLIHWQAFLLEKEMVEGDLP